MDISNGILLGIIALIFWSLGDIFAKRVIARMGVMKTLLAIMGLSIVPLVFIALLFSNIFSIPKNPILIVTAALLNIIAFGYYYKGIEIGKISVIAPIVSSNSVIPVLLGIFFLKEVLMNMQIIMIFLIIFGAILTSTKFSELRILKIKAAEGTGHSFIAMFLWGIVIFLVALIVKEFDFILTVLWFRVLGVFFLVCFYLIRRKNIFNIRLIKDKLKEAGLLGKVFSAKYVGWFVLLVTIFETIGFLAFGAGMKTGFISIVAPIACATPAVIIILARIFYKEKLELNQYLGVFLILIGIISLASF